jgi:ABC-type glycerol-3-phosphate transport system substrate-binding protein
MRVPLRAPLIALALAVATACGPRQVEVRTAPTTASEQAVQVTNNLSQAVNVYVTTSGSGEIFLRQIPANTVEKVAVQGVPSGTSVTFKAVTVDGARTYQSRSVALAGLFVWGVP